MFEDISDTDFSDVEELVVNDARSETSFAASLNSVACDNVTAIANNFGVGIKPKRNDILGAWDLMELKTGGLDQKFCNARHMADETQMCTTECTVDTFENWTSSGGNDRQLVSETQNGQNDKTADNRSIFAQLGKEMVDWVLSQLNESEPNSSVLAEPTDEYGGKMLELTEHGNPMRSQCLQCCTVVFMMINSLGERTLHCINLFYQDKLIKHSGRRDLFKKMVRETCV